MVLGAVSCQSTIFCCIQYQLFVSVGFRFETVDLATRLLIPIIVLQNHNRYNIMEKGQNYSIDIGAIEAEVHFSFGSLYLLLFSYGFRMGGHIVMDINDGFSDSISG